MVIGGDEMSIRKHFMVFLAAAKVVRVRSQPQVVVFSLGLYDSSIMFISE